MNLNERIQHFILDGFYIDVLVHHYASQRRGAELCGVALSRGPHRMNAAGTIHVSSRAAQ